MWYDVPRDAEQRRAVPPAEERAVVPKPGRAWAVAGESKVQLLQRCKSANTRYLKVAAWLERCFRRWSAVERTRVRTVNRPSRDMHMCCALWLCGVRSVHGYRILGQ